MSAGSTRLDRAARTVADRLLDWSWTRGQITRFGRYLVNRANGDNDADMASNGELALVAKLPDLFAGRPATVIDAGANVGEWSNRVRRALPSQSAIYAFEPVSSVFEQLERNVKASGEGAPVVCVNAALSDADGDAEIRVYGGGASALHDRSTCGFDSAAVRRERVRRMRGDTFCQEHGIERVGFLKIDVEGHELAVFRGFARMLAERRIDGMQFEYGGTWIDAKSWLAEAFELLREHGYVVGKLHRSGVRWHARYDPSLESFQYANYVAARPDWQEALAALS